MSLTTNLQEYIAACFTGLWIQSHEHEDALAEIAQLCRNEDWRLATWDISRGLQVSGQNNESESTGSDPLAAIRSINTLASSDSSAILVLSNFHRFMNSAEIVQALQHQIVQGKQNRTFIVILSPVVQVPTELDKQIVVIEHELPAREQLEELARSIATEDGELPEGDELVTVLDATAGLTRYEAEAAFSLSLVREQAIRPQSIWELKSQMLKKRLFLVPSRLADLHRLKRAWTKSTMCVCVPVSGLVPDPLPESSQPLIGARGSGRLAILNRMYPKARWSNEGLPESRLVRESKECQGVPHRKHKLTAAEKQARRERNQKYMTIFVNGKQKQVPRPPEIDGSPVDEFIARNADPIWLHQNEMWDLMDLDSEDQTRHE